MKSLKEYTIPFVGLKIGTHHFDFKIDNTFFQNFDYQDFNESNVAVDLEFEKKANMLELDFKCSGYVNVNCHLTNEPFDQPISGNFKLIVKFGDVYNDDNEEIIVVPHNEFEINVAQYIYEMIVLAVPAKCIHPGVKDGTLKSEILEKLKELSPSENKNKRTEETDPRWDTLKKLLTDK
ncbi:YceD family protein [Aegicerativicinus sediminis]